MQTPAKPVLKRLCGLFIWFSTLCTTDEKRLEIAVFRCVSGNSDPEGRWFESSRAHHQAEPGRNSRSGLSFFILPFRSRFQWVSILSTFPSREPRRASRVRGFFFITVLRSRL